VDKNLPEVRNPKDLQERHEGALEALKDLGIPEPPSGYTREEQDASY
jgi:hypothetical protein